MLTIQTGRFAACILSKTMFAVTKCSSMRRPVLNPCCSSGWEASKRSVATWIFANAYRYTMKWMQGQNAAMKLNEIDARPPPRRRRLPPLLRQLPPRLYLFDGSVFLTSRTFYNGFEPNYKVFWVVGGSKCRVIPRYHCVHVAGASIA